MIIISQNEFMIINFKKIEEIHIAYYEEKFEERKVYRIISKSTKMSIILAEYKTEERAKEVLKEIIKAYQGYEHDKVFYMPEE